MSGRPFRLAIFVHQLIILALIVHGELSNDIEHFEKTFTYEKYVNNRDAEEMSLVFLQIDEEQLEDLEEGEEKMRQLENLPVKMRKEMKEIREIIMREIGEKNFPHHENDEERDQQIQQLYQLDPPNQYQAAIQSHVLRYEGEDMH